MIRAATPADAPAIVDLINAVDAIELGFSEWGLDEMRADLAEAADLATDSWLGYDGDRLVSYGILWEKAPGRLDIDHYVLPGSLTVGLDVLDRSVERAAAVAGAGFGKAAVHLALTPASALVGELPARGWRTVRRHDVLRRPVSVAADPVPEPPAGVSLRAAAGAADQRRVYELLEIVMADEFDHQPRTYEAWRTQMGADDLDWSVVWIASLDGVDVAACLGRHRETMGWVRSLGTLPAARGRGVATFLLRTAFAGFARAGRDMVGLGVDTENPTGAPRLYRRLGFVPHYAAITWERVVAAT